MIKAALVPVSREIQRVDQSSASVAAAEKIHARMERFEERLLGYPADRWDARGREVPPNEALAMPKRVVDLELAIHGFPATEPEDSPRIVEGNPEHIFGRLEVLEHRADAVRNEVDSQDHHLSALITVVSDVLKKKLNVDILPRLRADLARVEKEQRDSHK